MNTTVDKATLRDALVRVLRDELETLRRYAVETRKAATHEEAKAENDKDTRGLEQSYLARGQAMRVEEVDEAIKRLRFMELPTLDEGPIGIGALVEVQAEEGEARWLFMTPAAGGTKAELEGRLITALTPAAPLGRALVGKFEGDEIELRRGGSLVVHEILQVC